MTLSEQLKAHEEQCRKDKLRAAKPFIRTDQTKHTTASHSAATSTTTATTFNQEVEVISPHEIQEVTFNFTEQLNELDKALQQTKDAKELASRVQNKGFFATLWGGATGASDKELAESVKILGASVEITQKILDVVLRVTHTKNQFLKSFHTALTEKILSLNSEMDVCHGNQKNAKQAAITIATQLRSQIEEKIRQSEMIEEHEAEISDLKDHFNEHDNHFEEHDKIDNKLMNGLEEQELINIQQQNTIDELDNTVDVLENTIEKLKSELVKQNAISKELNKELDAHKISEKEQLRTIDELKTELEELKTELLDHDNIDIKLHEMISKLTNNVEQSLGLLKNEDARQDDLINNLQTFLSSLEDKNMNLEKHIGKLDSHICDLLSELSVVKKRSLFSGVVIFVILIGIIAYLMASHSGVLG